MLIQKKITEINSAMKIILNGKAYRPIVSATISELLSELKQRPDRVVVELNSAIIQREQYQTAALYDGDKVEIVRLVGGG
jgi:sulfur carrier protein